MKIICIDGGGTHTRILVVTDDGEFLSEHIEPISLNFSVLGEAKFRDTIIQLLSGYKNDTVVLGLAGAGRTAEQRRIREIMQQLGFTSIAIYSDVEIAFHGAFLGHPGILVIAGTGSIAYGEYRGRKARAGGWGYLLGDDGSGFWIGRTAIRKALEYLERGQHNLLTTTIMEMFSVSDWYDILTQIYQSSSPVSKVASIAPKVFELTDTCDEAHQIIQEAGRRLAHLVNRVATNLSYEGKLTIRYTGGIWKNKAKILPSFEAELQTLGWQFEVYPPLADPVWGAAFIVAQERGLDELRYRILERFAS